MRAQYGPQSGVDMSGFIANLGLSRKLGLIGLVAAILAAVPMGLYVDRVSIQMAGTRSEIAGLAPSRALLDVLRLAQQHRGLSANVLGGKKDIEPKRAAKQDELDKATAVFDAIVRHEITDTRVRDDWASVTGKWKTLAPAVASRGITGPQSYAAHTEMIGAQIELHDRLADLYGLTLDPSASSYFLIIGTLQQLPRLTELLGQARARGSLMLARQTASLEDKAFLGGLTDLARANLRDVEVTIAKAFDAHPAYRTTISPKLDAMRSEVAAVIALARERIVTAEKLDYPSGEYFDGCTRAIDSLFALVDEADKALETTLLQRQAGDKRELWITAGAALTLGALGLWFGLTIARSIIRPAQAARIVSARIAAGDLTVEIHSDSTDEMGQLLTAMGEMQQSLTRTVGTVRLNADAVATASSQIAQGNLDLSQRTEEQASALEQTAASMHELGSTVSQNADNAKQASQLALAATGVATRGGEVVGQVVQTMSGIHESSNKIADIIGVIDGIAFQTNILALNAAVEAARAGEQGRGFAVVASEVRNLAQRSASAAKEIKTLITDSVERVGRGTTQVGQAGETMKEVVASIRRVADLIGEISSASSEQSTSVAQVGEAIQQMDQVTQQNAALVEQSAAAAESMREQARALVDAVAVFRLSDDVYGSPA